MFNIGIGELIIIMGVALLFLGPERFPVFAKVIMHTYRDFRRYKDEMMHEITRALAPVKKELRVLSRYNPEDYVESLALAVATEPKDDKKKDKDEEKTESVEANAESADETPAEVAASSASGSGAAAAATAEHPAGTEPRQPARMDEPYPD